MSFAVGFAFLGPLLVTVAGPSVVLGVVAVFYAAATAVTFQLPSAPPIPLDRERGGKAGADRRILGEPIDQLRDGLVAIGGNQEIRARSPISRRLRPSWASWVSSPRASRHRSGSTRRT